MPKDIKKSFMPKDKKRSYLINLIAVVALFVVMMALISGGAVNKYLQGIILLACINIILASSLNITSGFLGQIALGHAGFMSIGAYTAGIFSKALAGSIPDGPRFIIAIILGGLLAAAFGILVGIPALRLKGDYLAIITLGFGEIIRVIIENLEITGGAQGLRSIPRIATLPVVFWVTIIVLVLLYTFVRSRHGRAIIAIREDDIASEASGINNTYYKVLAFSVAAFFAGVAGGIYAQYLSVLSAKAFAFTKSIDILVMVVLGGMGSLTGSVVAAIALTILPEALRQFAEYRMVIYAVALVVVMIYKPSGLLGKYEFSLTKLIDKITGRSKKPAVAKSSEDGGDTV